MKQHVISERHGHSVLWYQRTLSSLQKDSRLKLWRENLGFEKIMGSEGQIQIS